MKNSIYRVFVCLCLTVGVLTSPASAAAPGRFNHSVIGGDGVLINTMSANGGATTYAMASLNTGACFRFMAIDTRDVASVRFMWNTVASPGTVTLRIETIDATTGKPSGTLYDASATKAFTPTAGWQLVTFDSLPTAGLTAGTEYAIVLLTTTGGTTQTLRAYAGSSAATLYPASFLSAADGTTRSNFAEVAIGSPIATVVFENAVEETLGFTPFSAVVSYNVFGTNADGMKFVVPTGETWTACGACLPFITRTGTPAGDLRVRILNSSDAAVSGSTVTVDKDSLTNVASKRMRIPFLGQVTLAAGTYRVVFDSASSANSSNCWTLKSIAANSSAMVPSGTIQTSTTDVTAGTISWTDTATEQPGIQVELDDITASGGGGGVSRARVVNRRFDPQSWALAP